MPSVSRERIEALALAALTKQGASALQGRAHAAGTGAAERDGLVSQGLMYLPIYCEPLTCGALGYGAGRLAHAGQLAPGSTNAPASMAPFGAGGAHLPGARKFAARQGVNGDAAKVEALA
jgi:LDH2 family malate/lactate/ureidoglycolate dehydrogenase